MDILRLVLLLTLASSDAIADSWKELAPRAGFRSDATLVLVPVTVTDRHGAVIQGLGPEAFSVFEDKIPQQIVSFNEEDVACSVGVIFDLSGSMARKAAVAKAALRAFVDRAEPDDEAFLVGVSDRPETKVRFTRELGEIMGRISLAKTGGNTALVDTVYVGLRLARDARNTRRALLVLSDGMDNHSRYSESELLRAALESDVQIHTIALYDPKSEKALALQKQARGVSLLSELAARTGGLHFAARNGRDIDKAVKLIGRALRTRYVIGYRPDTSTGQEGKWRTLQVKVALPEARVRARTGYYDD
jgi:Ca-activated chloride channel family protein